MRLNLSIPTAIACLMLSACGGAEALKTSASPGTRGAPSGASIFGNTGTPITVAQSLEGETLRQSLLDSVTAGTVAFERPALASAELSGMISAGDDAAMTMGKMTLNMDFTADTLTGSTSDFAVFTGAGASRTKVNDLSGALTITNGAISGSTLSADVAGSLSGAGGTSYNGQILGGFVTQNGTVHAVGGFSGTAQTGGASPERFNNGRFLVSE